MLNGNNYIGRPDKVSVILNGGIWDGKLVIIPNNPAPKHLNAPGGQYLSDDNGNWFFRPETTFGAR